MGAVISFILDACFPRYCLTCKEEGSLVCGEHARNFTDVLKYEGGDHFASFAYGNPLVRDLIKAWKYDFDSSAFSHIKKLGESTIPTLRELLKGERMEAIVPLPLSKRRENERGFNQSMVIGKWIEEFSAIPVKEILLRKESSGHQAERTDEERKAAMQDSPFSFKGGEVPESVLLVDDVWTTGATMEAAARTLKAAGVERVFFYTLAKGR
jgi:ComF family protein